MKRVIKYNSINTYSTMIKNLKKHISYKKDKMKHISCSLTEKIHGANAAVCFSNPDGFWVQSRERIITIEDDNAGCAFDAYSKQEIWTNLILDLAYEYNIDLNKNIISLYYEFAGGRIQKNSCLSGLNKKNIIFAHFKVSLLEPSLDDNGDMISTDDQPAYWLETSISDTNKDTKHPIKNEDSEIYNVLQFNQYLLTINLDLPSESINNIIKIVDQIEQESPIGKYFGKQNIGEGVVGTIEYDKKLYKFKAKGEKHVNSKVKTLKPATEEDLEQERQKIKLVEIVATAGRCEQAWQAIFGIENEKNEPSMQKMGDFLRWIHKDIMKEHQEDYIRFGLEPKSINSKISLVCRAWFNEQLSEYNLGLVDEN